MAARAASRSPDRPGYLLGFALGGFFDGILLHQVLQWHHLLSALEGRDVRFQVAADGYFHLLMYALAVAGLWLLWRAPRTPGEGRRLLAAMLIGFGLWHAADAALSHWVLGIHRIRMDSADPLIWDLAWLFAFGLAPLVVGLALRRARPASGPPAAAARLVATALALGAGAVAAGPPADDRFAAALFAPGTPPGEALLAVAALGGRIAWTDPTGELVVYDRREAAGALALYRRGAILVSGGGLPAGCFGWARPSRAAAAFFQRP